MFWQFQDYVKLAKGNLSHHKTCNHSEENDVIMLNEVPQYRGPSVAQNLVLQYNSNFAKTPLKGNLINKANS